MTFQELAKISDSRDYPREAAWAYELTIQEEDANLKTFLDLAVLYFTCTDFGYGAHHNLLPEFSAKAYERALEILYKAEGKFGRHAEIDFWKLYLPFVALGAEPFDEDCKRLASSGESLIPYFYLYSYVDQERYQVQAEDLLQRVRGGETAKKRYIKSVLESALARLRNRKV